MTTFPTRTGGSGIEVVMIVRDEELNLAHTLPSIVGWADRVWVVDSGSTDRIMEVARAAGCEVVHLDWQGYARQKNWALDTLPLAAPWILILDADEAVTPALREALMGIARRDPAQVPESAFHINRHFVFLGGVIHHCGYDPSWNVRFFKKGRALRGARRARAHGDGRAGRLHPR